jgi:pimeloyl-ACP methyl ester carboxylesterase
MRSRTRIRRSIKVIAAALALILGGSAASSAPSFAADLDEVCPYQSTDFTLPYQMIPYSGADSEFYYRYFSKNSGPLVVLIAGIPEPHYFDAELLLLLRANYRVLILDLPGKEHTRLSGQPTAPYVARQFQLLWNSLGLDRERGPLIVGTSMSGPVAAALSIELSEQEPKLALVSALGLPRAWPVTVEMGKIPLLSDLLAPLMLPAQIRRDWTQGEILCPQNFPQLFARQKTELSGPESNITYLKLLRALVLTDQTSVYRRLQTSSIPVALVNGDHDPFVDQAAKLQRIIPRANRIEIKASAHIPFIEQPISTFEILDRNAP